ncbi:MAG: GMC family oxidoreductase [Acidobacteriota bacterium]
MWERLSNSAGQLKDEYQTVIVGSGYGGSVIAARLAEQGHSVCLLERGKEWQPGDFPDSFKELAGNVRSKGNPLALIDYYLCDDIDVLKGNGLGGTSLLNLNVAYRPDREFFEDPRWPSTYRGLGDSGEIWKYYQRAESVLRPNHHPRWSELTKVQRVKQRFDELTDAQFGPVNITVNFDLDGEKNAQGVTQYPCIDCGDCFPGCNVGAKNALYMNYLPYARQKGAEIHTRIEVRHLAKRSGGGWEIVYRHNKDDRHGEDRRLLAHNVVLAAGSVGSTEILLRSETQGLAFSGRLGYGFSGNGDFIGLAYNNDVRCDTMGYGNHPDSKRAQVKPGPTIVSSIQYDRSRPFAERITLEDFALLPSALVDTYRRALPGLAALTGEDTDHGLVDKAKELARVGQDQIGWNPNGALNHSMVYLVMAFDDAKGRMHLNDKGRVDIEWPSVRTDPIFRRIEQELEAHAHTLGGTWVHLDRPGLFGANNLITAHALGGCDLGDDADHGVVDADCQVFDGEGGVHQGLFVVDGAVVGVPIGVNPFLTIAAIAERTAETMPNHLVQGDAS